MNLFLLPSLEMPMLKICKSLSIPSSYIIIQGLLQDNFQEDSNKSKQMSIISLFINIVNSNVNVKNNTNNFYITFMMILNINFVSVSVIHRYIVIDNRVHFW